MQQWKFFKNKFSLQYFIQIYKILHSVKQDWSISGWSDHNRGTETCDNRCNFLNFANFNQFLEIASCCHFRRPTDIVLDFFYPQTPYFMLVTKFVPDGIKEYIRNCKKMLKESFQNTFLCRKVSTKVKWIKMPLEKQY